MGAEFISDVLKEFGLKDIPPYLNESNKKAQSELTSKQVQIEKFKSVNVKSDENISSLTEQITHAQEFLSHTKHLITSRNEALTSEKEMLIAAHLNLERNTRESVEQSKVLAEISSKNQKLNEDLSKKVAQNQLMENECKSQMETVEKRSKDVEEYERDIDGILKFRFKDKIRIKWRKLKLDKLKVKAQQKKTIVNAAITRQRMVQLKFDKISGELQALQQERETTLGKWQEATDQNSKQEELLQDAIRNVKLGKFCIKQHQGELKDQMARMCLAQDSVTAVKLNIGDLKREAVRLQYTLEKKAKELVDIEAEADIEKKQMLDVGVKVDSKRSKLNRCKRELRKKESLWERLNNDLDGKRRKKMRTVRVAKISTNKVSEMRQLLDKEESQYNLVLVRLNKLIEKKLAKEQVLKEILVLEEANKMTLQNLGLEIKNLAGTELAKREDIAIASTYNLAQMERKSSLKKESEKVDKRINYKEAIEKCKSQLETGFANKRNLLHLVNKMAADVRKVKREIDTINAQKENIRSALEKSTDINKSCEKYHAKFKKRLKALMAEQKELKVGKKKSKESLEELKNEIIVLRKLDRESHVKSVEERREAERLRNMLAVHLICLKDELDSTRQEIKEKKVEIQKLKMRYKLTSKVFKAPMIKQSSVEKSDFKHQYIENHLLPRLAG